MSLFRFENVTKRYHYDNFDVLKDFSFEMNKGQCTLLIDMQSGKSTFCKLLCGMEKPSAGNIYWENQPLDSVCVEERNILYLMQNPIFFENRTLLANLEYPLKVRKIKNSKEIAFAQLKNFSLEQFANVKIRKLSKDQRSLFAIARGFLRKPKLVLLDSFCDDLPQDQIELVNQLIVENNCSALYLTADANKIFTKQVAIYFDNKPLCMKENVQQTLKDVVWLHNLEEQNEQI